MPLDLSLVGKATKAETFTYTWHNTVLYALGIGAKRDELDYLFEGRGPKVFPSFAVVPKFGPLLDALSRLGGNLAMVVHGGEKVTIHKPFPSAATLHTTATVRAVYDKRKFAQVLVDTESKDEKGEPVATTTSSIIYRGEGGFGGEPGVKEPSEVELPKGKEPDFRVEETTSPEQALLYRLSGDMNPLHADPELAKQVGFERGPILHGLCTFGYMLRHATRAALAGDAGRLLSFEGQFRRPVWPGDTIVTEGFHVAPGVMALSASVKERAETVISGAFAKFKE